MKKFLVMSVLIVVGCASGNCRSQRGAEPVDGKKLAEQSNRISVGTQERVKVFKYDGSLQCGMGKAVPVSEMAKELQGITVYSAENKPDGLMHIQLCGSPTGRANVYEIDKSALEEAKKKGFKEWTFE